MGTSEFNAGGSPAMDNRTQTLPVTDFHLLEVQCVVS